MTEQPKETAKTRKKTTRKRKKATRRTSTEKDQVEDSGSTGAAPAPSAKQIAVGDIPQTAAATTRPATAKKPRAKRAAPKRKAPVVRETKDAAGDRAEAIDAVHTPAAIEAEPQTVAPPTAAPSSHAPDEHQRAEGSPTEPSKAALSVSPAGGPPSSGASSGEPSEAPPRRGRRRRRRRGGGDGRHGDDRSPGTGPPPAARPVPPVPRPSEQRPPARDERDRPGSRPPDRRDDPRRGSPPAQPDRSSHGRDTRDERPAPPQAQSAKPASRFVVRPQVPAGQSLRELLINVSAGDECRVAVMQDGRLEELFIERSASQSHVGNIYKGRVTNIEPSIQAAFIDFGLQQNGFLHISDVQPQYFPDHRGASEDVGRKIPRMHRPPIQSCFRRGQEVIVQVTKEGVGTKGPTLTTYLSIPGRYLVMMPGMSRHGVSRKIEDDAERRTMRDLLKELNLPSGMGFILRTAGMGRTKREIQRDLNYLTRLWKIVAERIKSQPAPAELYQESDLVTRTTRDVYTTDFHRIVVDSPETEKKIRDFLDIALPRTKVQIDLYSDREPLFHRFRLEEEIERINMRHVPLPSGGSLVIDSTEALVAIDVNSGRSRVHDDAEEMAYKINMEAAEEIARQLRLRDLGGLIICDFIDMRADRHKRGVERCLRDALKKHKERARILKMSAFGLIEMTRQRQGPSMKRNLFFDCPHCKGSGLVKMPESVILDVMRIIQLAINHDTVQRIIVTVSSQVAFQILNTRRAALAEIERDTGKQVVVRGDATFTSDQVDYLCEDGRGQPVNVLPPPPTARPGRRP